MYRDQAWPSGIDFAAGGGLHEYKLRLLNGFLFGLPALALASWASPPRDASWNWLLNLLGPGMLWALPLTALGIYLMPLRSGPVQLDLGAAAHPPQLQRPGNLLSYNPERRDGWALVLVLVLALLGGPLSSLAFVALMGPLVAYRFLSRLWTEVDLEHGRIYYHRTFCGLQITRPGADLDQAKGVVSGTLLERPGEEPCYAVCIVLAGSGSVPLNTHCLTRPESHELGHKLSLQLDLPHMPVERAGQVEQTADFRPKVVWKPIGVGGQIRSKLPPGGEDE